MILHLERLGLAKLHVLFSRLKQIMPSLLAATFLYIALILFGSIFLVLPGLYVMFTMMFYSIEMFMSATVRDVLCIIVGVWRVTTNGGFASLCFG